MVAKWAVRFKQYVALLPGSREKVLTAMSDKFIAEIWY